MLYFKEGITVEMLKPLSNDKNREFFLVKINLGKKKWLLICNTIPLRNSSNNISCVWLKKRFTIFQLW